MRFLFLCILCTGDFFAGGVPAARGGKRKFPDNELFTRRRTYERSSKGTTSEDVVITDAPSLSPEEDRAGGDGSAPPKGVIPAPSVTPEETAPPSSFTVQNPSMDIVTPVPAPSLAPADNPTTTLPVPVTPAPVSVTDPVVDPTSPSIPITNSPTPTTMVPATVPPTIPPVPAPVATPGPTGTMPPTPTLPPEQVDELKQRFEQALAPYPSYDTTALLEDIDSYQYKAMIRTGLQNGYPNFDVSKLIQYWVLFCILFSTNVNPSTGTATTASDNIFSNRQQEPIVPVLTWLNTDGWFGLDLDPCMDEGSWYGIICDTLGRVTEIRLQRNFLSGMFPPETYFLASDGLYASGAGSLQRLDLFNNPLLTNPTTTNWIEWLGTGLEVFNYGSTSFSGTIPKLPTGLIEFDCSYSDHTGPIPDDSFAASTNLELVILDGNNVSSLPTTLTKLPSLKFLYARDTSLAGDLPSLLEGMTVTIIELLIDGNPGLSGSIPTFIGDLTALRSFSATNCSLDGNLPSELADISNLTQLWLLGNGLGGKIPSALSNLQNLKILALEDNKFTGEMPFGICLQRLDGALTTLSVDCDDPVDCSAYFPDCCTCCGRVGCGT